MREPGASLSRGASRASPQRPGTCTVAYNRMNRTRADADRRNIRSPSTTGAASRDDHPGGADTWTLNTPAFPASIT